MLLDTGPLYGLLDPKDQWYERAGALFERLEGEGTDVVAAYPAMLETHRLLLSRQKVSLAHLHALIEDVFSFFSVLYPIEADADVARASLKRYNDQRITLTDATVAAMAVREGAQVATFDTRHFSLMGADVYQLEGPS